MKISVLTPQEHIVSLEVDSAELVENVKALLEVETQIPLQQQQLLYQGNELVNNQNLQVVGIVEGDLLILLHTPSRSGNSHSNELSLNPDGSAANPIAFLKHLKRDPQAINHLLERNPELAEAVLGDNVEALQNFLRQQHSHRLSLQQRQQQELELLNADPFDVDAQRRIEEAIQQKNIDENWEAAVEHNPEAFGRVVMLYVDMEVNGIPIKAFVDSGAQSTIISKACAERCGLLRLMDRRFRGIARGVGQSEIVGRIHVAPLKIGKNYYPCSFTVLDQPNLEFLFGLDMLRKHQCSIDLKDNVLRVGGEIAVPFLQEKDIPLHLHDEDAKIELQGGSTSAQAEPAGNRTMNTQAAPPSSFGGTSSSPLNSARNTNTASALELKVTRLVELGFDRASVIQALSLFNGNEEQAASYLFGG